MSFDRFRIGHDPGWGRCRFGVRVFDTKAEMLAHYARSPLLSLGEEDAGDAAGLSAPRAIVHVNRRGRVTKMSPRIGIILLNAEHLNSTVLIHECLHAAFTIYRWGERNGQTRKVDLGTGGTNWSMRLEEYLCYLHGSLVEQLGRKLHARGLLA